MEAADQQFRNGRADVAEEIAQIELFDPLEQPSDYGGSALATDLANIEHLEGGGPELTDELVDALEIGDYAAAESLLSPVRDWFDKRDYQILDEGVVEKFIPFLVAQAPNVDGVSVASSQETTGSAGGEFSFKVFGSGLGASAKITVASGVKLVAKANETLAYSVMVPIHWERRADRRNEDINWVVTEIQDPSQKRVKTRKSPLPANVSILSSFTSDNTEGGSEPVSLSKSYAVETGSDFTLGLKIESLGIDTSVKVSAAVASKINLEASLPTGYSYTVAWLGSPWGARITT